MTEKPLINPANEKVVSLEEETKFAPNDVVSRTLLKQPCGIVRFRRRAGIDQMEALLPISATVNRAPKRPAVQRPNLAPMRRLLPNLKRTVLIALDLTEGK